MELNQNTSLMELKQTGLIDRVIKSLVLHVRTRLCNITPAVMKPLVKDADGDPALGTLATAVLLEYF